MSSGTPRYQVLNINNLTTWHRSDGHSNHSPGADNGVYFPRETGNVIYQDCIVWGGKVFRDAALTIPYSATPLNQNIRVGGGTYSIGTRAGAVVGFGENAVAEDPNGPSVRAYRIRRDYATMRESEYRRDAQSYFEHSSVNDVTQSEIDQIKAWYVSDWTNWPVTKGAPYIDRNGNGVYDPPPAFNTDWTTGTVFTAESLIAQGWDEPGVSGPDTDIPAEQVIWTVYNDLNVIDAQNFEGSLPLGLEVQKTVWGYKRNDVLGNFYFVRYIFTNRGGVDTSEMAGDQFGSFWIDSMYVGQWSDPDVGSFSDDFVGCDTALGLMFAYNANSQDPTFRQYNLPPPSVGYDFLAGPTVPDVGATAIVNFSRQTDLRNLPATSFTFFSAGSPYSDPPGGSSEYLRGTGRWWHLLRGYAPLGDLASAPQPYYHPPEFPMSKFPLSGDPITRSGWTDGYDEVVAGDRRMIISTGPFRLAPGDRQEVYVGVAVGIGADRLSSIAIMKLNDKYVQALFDNLFRVPSPPAPPVVTVRPLDGEIILDWGSDAQAVARTEDEVSAGVMAFEGYNVYQLPKPSGYLADAVNIATFDVENGIGTIIEEYVDYWVGVPLIRILQRGPDDGVQRSYRLTVDKLSDPNPMYARDPLINGKEYHFAVTAYNRNIGPSEFPASLESDPVLITIKPQIPFGERAQYRYGDTISVTRVSGSATGSVNPIVVDPLKGTGDRYRVTFVTGGPDGTVAFLRNHTLQADVFSFPVHAIENAASRAVVGGVRIQIDDAIGAISGADVFEFVIPGTDKGSAIIDESTGRVGVFPNPYYARNEWATSSLKPFVTFNNLPRKAVFRIFNLAGQLVRTLEKDSDSQFFDWDLRNEHGWLVASGMYICHVEMPEIQVQRILKLAVIQENPVGR